MDKPGVIVIDDDSQTRDTFHLAYPKLTVIGVYPNVENILRSAPPR